ncbi:class I SAM-dependent methyltransferase [Paenibacillus athensensis]|uniref:SAM-dependent methyltransferase n=1 Tax=Paenibacillus athensensis TaxID=1967502 RepID=A0A4Y8PXX3_9BACL|nr:class I SAM-dependent methyltransferase [Paenibacillus athensensis]MCD1261497.1 class I SAM-dependent methyltransferase [Paenibacillus athensensis]
MLQALQAIEAYRSGADGTAGTERPAWLELLVSAEERIVNLERIRSMRELALANPVLDYVERTLRVLDGLDLSFWIRELIEEALAWSETAKGGTVRERLGWQEAGINLLAHNVGSAELYRRHQARRPDAKADRTAVVATLIATHGLIGQYLRGEVPFAANAPLAQLCASGLLSPQELTDVLLPLNACIIAAINPDLWASVRPQVEAAVASIASGQTPPAEGIAGRLKRLRAGAIARGESFAAECAKLPAGWEQALTPLAGKTLWYVEPALQDFSLEQVVKVLLLALRAEGEQPVEHLSFERLMNAMYYDYRGVKKINVYKKRIIEHYLRGLSLADIAAGALPDSPHLAHELERGAGDTAYFSFAFSPAAEKLIEFCIEAEKSPLYEKAVLLLFDLFELRRDAYDRFHNEEDYLATMNQSADYKKIMLAYMTGRRVVDIGPGGGVLLDLIESEYPDKEPIGIDISANVIEALERKKQREGRRWQVLKGDALNLKEYVAPGSIDTVIFSSILHELYSYIPFNGRKFNHETVAAALQSAYDVLAPGGRIIIRDGIMSEPKEQLRLIRFRDPQDLEWLRRYAGDFTGRPIRFEQLDAATVRLPINDAMEFLYTYTWGEEAYVHEVQEQFGYFTPSEYAAFIRHTLGGEARLVEAKHFLQAGYTEALAPKIELLDDSGNPVALPDSTCLLVIEKPL